MDADENGLLPCDKCKGEGKFLVPGKQIDKDTYAAVFKICDKCLGEGKLDWIEMALGKKKSAVMMDDDILSAFDDEDAFIVDRMSKKFISKKAPPLKTKKERELEDITDFNQLLD